MPRWPAVGIDVPGGETRQVVGGGIGGLDAAVPQAKSRAVRLRQQAMNRLQIDARGFCACRQAEQIAANTATEIGNWTVGREPLRFVAGHPLIGRLFQGPGREKQLRGGIELGCSSVSQIDQLEHKMCAGYRQLLAQLFHLLHQWPGITSDRFAPCSSLLADQPAVVFQCVDGHRFRKC